MEVDKLRSEIEKNGFAIAKGVVPKEDIAKLREFWLDFFKNGKKFEPVKRGLFRLGHHNFLGHTDNKFWKLKRHFGFLWNKPTHKPTWDVSMRLHKIRNQIQGFDENRGLMFSPDNYGVYISTSYYYPGSFLTEHTDTHYTDTPLIHYMLTLTFKGEHYDEGGLVAKSKDGREVNIDDLLEPGDILFFDGRIKHGVKEIKGKTGRLATFAIPVNFYTYEKVPRLSLWIENKIDLIKFLWKTKVKGEKVEEQY